MARQIIILGAGISGLATAWFLKKQLGAEANLTVLEKNSRIGGWIQSAQVDGFLFEQGPRSCRSRGAGRKTLELVEALGLHKQIVTAHPAARDRFLYWKGRLQALPRHPFACLFSPLMKGWMRTLWRDLKAARGRGDDESIYSFFNRHLDPAWTDRLIDPFVSGIYAGDLNKLSIKSCFPLLDKWEQEQGSLLKAAWRHPKRPPSSSAFVRALERSSLFSFQDGLETLPRALAAQLEGTIRLNCGAQSLALNKNGVKIKLENGEELEADQLISTLPAQPLSSLLSASLPTLSAVLHRLNYATVFVVNLGYRQKVLKQEGFGYLIPFQEGEPVLGCVWDSCVFPQQNRQEGETRLTVMIGGTRHPLPAAQSDSDLLQLALSALERHLHITQSPDSFSIKSACQAIPQYEVGHQEWIHHAKEQMSAWPHVVLSGTPFHGVSVNDCIAEAEQVALQCALQK
ncbi:protoporphyrinogen oxidase [Candidatus Protochlamydia phocaeensis]|uniref:protoporphyrinogen oxidase n=1 Tax=Candidatus Protochlamydia phocaeensis TaxID=1414722 RepID=UPI000839462A|nr:protoporphyrinogen oxidase [Candidatus Protochlamydia phocaeensis]